MFARPEYRWTEGRHPLQWLVNAWHALLDWAYRTTDKHPAVLLPFILVLLALLAHLGWTAWKIYQSHIRTPDAARRPGAPVLVDARAHLARADALARAGRYAEALGHRFVAVVLELERPQALKFHPSKTPAEYVAEARLDDAGKGSFAGLVASLYRHLFGAEPVDATGYAAFGESARVVVQHVLPG